MKLELLFLGKTKDLFLADGIDEYSKRLKHYTNLSLTFLKSKKNTGQNEEKIKESEGEILLSNTPPGAFVVALDAGGKQFSSEEMAILLSEWEGRGLKQVNFIIGGPLGLSDRVKSEAHLLLSLSRMTFTHDMVRMFLLEQLYRAYTIKAGEKYHK